MKPGEEWQVGNLPGCASGHFEKPPVYCPWVEPIPHLVSQGESIQKLEEEEEMNNNQSYDSVSQCMDWQFLVCVTSMCLPYNSITLQ